MRNYWVTRDEPLATWVADLTARRHDPEALIRWLGAVLGAGEECRVYTVHEAPSADYRREEAGPFADLLDPLFRSTGAIDLFQFSNWRPASAEGPRFRVTARMAYFDQEGRITEEDVEDLGLLLRRLRPADVDTAAGLMARCHPLEVEGPRIDFIDPERSVWALKVDRVRIRFRLFSDIWFPWVLGFLEENFDLGTAHDNRPLAERHTTRLNRFLSEAAGITQQVGGNWGLDEEDSHRGLLPTLEATGIRLDVGPPGGKQWPTPSGPCPA
jgi:hypothetical protein